VTDIRFFMYVIRFDAHLLLKQYYYCRYKSSHQQMAV